MCMRLTAPPADRFGRPPRILLSALVLALVWLCSPTPVAWAQPDEEEPEFPDAKDITLTTQDHVLLKCTYFAKPKDAKGKETVPIILVHGWDGQRGDYNALAKALQKKGHAVIVPDLRGHGESTRIKRADGSLKTMPDRSRMRTTDVQHMMTYDLETVKSFLVDENNDEDPQLNLDLLCVVGAEEGAVLALHWTAMDWSWPELSTGKQGQFVKAYVLLSPPAAFKTLIARNALQHRAVARTLPAQIIVGRKGSRSYTNANRLHTTLKNLRSRTTTDDNRNLYFEELDTSLQGTRLLDGKGLRVADRIIAFIEKHVASKRDEYPWEERGDPR